ncbi:putative 2-aminoethylphosphonate ABC transporter ATP-binding protein [Floridanema evergladense]|uniref:2-aminoethylphosphonate ABC transporter ATP-binding protein n=1 Tax=Floridaenema evergladense BLCC-F167 TaxID=3153639 RepID=A0ABV4WII8_9CYAN
MTYSSDDVTTDPRTVSQPVGAIHELPLQVGDLREERPEPYLQIENIHKTFGQFVALRDIYLDVYPGEFVCLLGPSGCGKTTLLRIIAGLEQQTSGRIFQGGKDVSRLPPAKRDFGIVFQSYALFPNLSAAQNIAYGLQNAKRPKQEIAARVEELLEMVGLQGFGSKYPAQMSGGQQQRIALARALALSPGLLLLDEPLSALDAKVRVKLRTEITQLQKRLGVTAIMVTHDQAEALAMGDRIVVMDKGYIAQVGTPRSIYQCPNTPFVANFIGVMNFLPGVVLTTESMRCGNLQLQTPPFDFPANTPISVAIRPEDIRVLHPDDDLTNLPNVVTAEIEGIEFLGSVYQIVLRPKEGVRGQGLGDRENAVPQPLTPNPHSQERLTCEVSIHEARDLDLAPNTSLQIQLPPDFIRVFPAEPS